MEKEEKQLKSKLSFDGKLLKLYVDEVLCPNGNVSIREYVKHPGGVCILAITDKDEILLEKQFRYPFNEEIYELPAGKLEKGEDPYLAAMRELEEETGYKADRLIDMGKMYPSVGYTDEVIHLYLANSLTYSHTSLDEDEIIDVIYVSLSKVKEMILNGSIKDAKTICLIGKYCMQYKK